MPHSMGSRLQRRNFCVILRGAKGAIAAEVILTSGFRTHTEDHWAQPSLRHAKRTPKVPHGSHISPIRNVTPPGGPPIGCREYVPTMCGPPECVQYVPVAQRYFHTYLQDFRHYLLKKLELVPRNHEPPQLRARYLNCFHSSASREGQTVVDTCH